MVKTPPGPGFRTICRRILVAIFLLLPGLSPAAPIHLPYFENFNSGTSQLVPASTANSSWAFNASKYRATISSTGVAAAATAETAPLPEGFFIEATLAVVDSTATDHTCGLGFLGEDANFTGGATTGYYLADVRPGANTVRVVKVKNGNTYLIENQPLDFALNPALPYKISVTGEYEATTLIVSVTVTQGSNVSHHANDDASPLTGAYFGFRSRTNGGTVTVDYDDFTLRDLTTVEFTSPPGGFAKPGIAYNSTVSAHTSSNGNVSITALEKPDWLTIDPSVDGTSTLSGTPPPGITGTIILKLQADDGNSPPVTKEFPLTVLGVSGVIISEFAASNDGSYLDEDGADSDWLELFNADPTPANLTGWSLKDDSTTWAIPAGTVLPPFGTLVVFASDKNRSTPRLHTNFKLSSNAGGYLALVRPDNSLASVYQNYPVQKQGVTYGAWGTYESTGYLLTPTPGTVNAPQGVLGFVPDPTFSVQRGVYTTTQALTISCPLAGSNLRYTLDGSQPTATNGIAVPPADSVTPPSVTLSVASTSVIRAVAFLTNYAPSTSVTHTYLFYDDVINQSTDGVPPAGYPAGPVNGQLLNYGMDPRITAGKTAEMKAAFAQLPVFSMVTDRDHLFSSATGIYVNAYLREEAWERPTSIEMFKPGGAPAFQINCGVRMRGGVSRDDAVPKHAFHFYFRGEYGATKLAYPLFDSEGANEFDRIDLRCSQNAWHMNNGGATYMQDEWSRATQGAMGQAYNRSRHVHLFINGQYWGIYNTEERADDAGAAEYFGGEPEDYDMVKNYTKPAHHVAVADGNDLAWTALYNAAVAGFLNDADYYAVQGLDPNGQPSATIKPLVDLDNLIDYMILAMFTGNGDGPVNPSANVPKNFFCFRPRDGRFGFRWIAHDFEDVFTSANVTGTLANSGAPIVGATLNYFNPRWLHIQLSKNPKYRMRFGDRVQRNLYNDGALSTASATARWEALRTNLRPAMIAESARWGDAKSPTSPHQVSEWETATKGIYNPATSGGYLTTRQATLIAQLRAVATDRPDKLFPSINAPVFSQFGGVVASGFNLTVTGPASTTLYYTLDGNDPSATGATTYTTAIVLNGAATTVKARAKHNTTGEWSALTEATFTLLPVAAAPGNLCISEMHYNPSDGSDTRDFIEIQNTSLSIVDLTGVKLSNGLTFTFPSLQLLPGQRIVVVESETAFRAFYGSAPRVAGVWDGALSNSGETIALSAANNTPIESVTYSDSGAWPTAPDGHGPSLVRINPALPANSASSWRRSTADHGTPGTPDALGLAGWLSLNTLLNGEAPAPSGLKVLAHFAAGISPTSNAGPPVKFVRNAANVDVTFGRRISAVDDVRFFIDQSPDLSGWPMTTEVDGSSTLIQRTANPDGTETLTVRIPTTGTAAFYRVRYVTR